MDNFTQRNEFYTEVSSELEGLVNPKTIRILLLSLVFYPLSFLLFGKWSRYNRWVYVGWIYSAPSLSFFILAFLSALTKHSDPDPYKAIAVPTGFLIMLLWPITVYHTFRIRWKYTVLSSSQDQLQQWRSKLADRRREEKKWEDELQAQEQQRKRQIEEEADSQRKILEEIYRERKARQDAEDRAHNQGRSEQKAHQGSKGQFPPIQDQQDQRWMSDDP